MLAGLLDPSFLLSVAPRLVAWGLVLVLATAAALPMCLRVFRALPDRGVGLAPALGVALTTLLAWWMGFAWFGQMPAALPVRGLMLVAAGAFAAGAWMFGERSWRSFVPPGLAAFLGLVWLPHSALSVWLALALVGGLSVLVWWGRWPAMWKELRKLAPVIATMLALLLGGLVLYASFRSYVPEAMFHPSGWGSEKFGNLMHLNSALRARTLPPADAWFAGLPSNYYYGGHLATATLAKASMTPAGEAFTMGLATTFALMLTSGSSLTLALLGMWRRWWGGAAPVGLGWGALGGVGVALFGNLDAWHQWAAAGTLEYFDFWRSSRAFQGAPAYQPAGTITEFPAFAAILGDHHPHYTALPYSMLVLAAMVAVHRGTVRRAAADTTWWARAWAPLAVAGVVMGFVYTVNVWDAVVLAPLVAMVVVVARRGILVVGTQWRWLAFFCLSLVLGVVASAAWNLQYGTVPLPGLGVGLLAMPLLAMAAALGLAYRGELKYGPAMALAAVAGLFVVCWAAAASGFRGGAGEQTPNALALGARDFGVLTAMAGLAAVLTLRRQAKGWHGFTSGGVAYLLVGVCALVVAAPFLLTTYTPLTPPNPGLLSSVVPPVFDREILIYPDGAWDEFWRRSTVRIFDRSLRTTLGDYLTHWGLLLPPLAALMLASAVLMIRRWSDGRGFAFGMVLVAVFVGAYNTLGYAAGPLALVMAVVALTLALNDRRRGALWALIAVGFLWHWFVEVFHFDDEMSGVNERYNTPYKVLYPLWPVFVAGAVAAVQTAAAALWPRPIVASEGVGALLRPLILAVLVIIAGRWLMAVVGAGGRFDGWVGLALFGLSAALGFAAWQERRSLSAMGVLARVADWLRQVPALVPALALLAGGLVYPYAAARVRTGQWGKSPIIGYAQVHPRTLDALAYFDYPDLIGGPRPGEREAMEWLRVHVERGALSLEAPPTAETGAYGVTGRMAAGSGVPTLLGWSMHERMWRGWQRPLPLPLVRRYAAFFEPHELQLGAVVAVFFSDRAQDLHAMDRLRRLALAPPASRLKLAGEFFPEFSAQRRLELVVELARPGVGTLTSNQLVDLMQRHAESIFMAKTFTPETDRILRFHNIRYVIIGLTERQRFDKSQLGKFADWEIAFQNEHVTIRRVPASIFAATEASTP